MAETIAVVDYGMGNLRSVAKALSHVAPKAHVVVTSDAAQIRSADRIVFPGQGAARDCMKHLQSYDLQEVVAEAFRNKPFLGICMGLQVLFEHSAENSGVACLALVQGDVQAFVRDPQRPEFKIPHMGWNRVYQNDHPLWNGIADAAHFYFVHSYYVVPQDSRWVIGETDYLQRYTSAVASDNVFATQFHPEKSADDGLRLLHNFAHWKLT